MPNYIRPRRPGATVFFTVCLAAAGTDLLVREVVTLREAVVLTRRERPFGIDAWVVLPDHMHCIWTLPDGDRDFSVRMGAIKARFSAMVRRAGFSPPLPASQGQGGVNPALRKGQVGIWQNRFWEHHIRNRADLFLHQQFCWMSPVALGLVKDPADWPHSSYLRDLQTRRAGFSPPLSGRQPHLSGANPSNHAQG